MNILITGGAGYIGSHVVKLLGENTAHEITIIDNLQSGLPKAVLHGQLIIEDLTHQDKIREIFRQKKFDAVMHFAADIDVVESLSNPLKYYQNNVVNSLKLLELCQEFDVNKFIFSSTAAVYGDSKEIVVNENAALLPISPYGESKRMIENVLQDMHKANQDFNFIALRYFNVAGASADGVIGSYNKNASHLIRRAALAALGKVDALPVYGTDYDTKDGTCVRDFIHVEDISSAHLASLKYLEAHNESHIINCGYGHGYSVLDVINTMRFVSGNPFKITYESRRAGDIKALMADNSKITALLEWKPQHDDLEQICRSTYEWERKF